MKKDNDKQGIKVEDIKSDVKQLIDSIEPIQHKELIPSFYKKILKVNLRELAGLKDENETLAKKHILVCSIEYILSIAQSNNWGICRSNGFIYLYNGAYWSLFDNEELQSFLGTAAEKMGVDKYDARFYSFREQLNKQFLSVANLPKPEQSNDFVFINLKNGTFEISSEKQELRAPRREDFMTHQLPFKYDNKATAPMFQAYLDKVQPDKERQRILGEYLGYLFIKPSVLKLEKTLLLYGGGANGKSVFFEIVNALLGGDKKVSSYSLQNLTDTSGYYRAMLANKLVNYASEINGKLETATFKQLVSGEPVNARLPYGEPFTLSNYAKLIFNCNELPKDVEQSKAYFRRFLIVPFDVTIPEDEQDKELSSKIINSELSGVFNWVLDGLHRLITQKKFTKSKAVDDQLELYKKNSDSVLLFLEEAGFIKSLVNPVMFQYIYNLYCGYCKDSGLISCSKKSMGERLRNAGIVLEKRYQGVMVYLIKQ